MLSQLNQKGQGTGAKYLFEQQVHAAFSVLAAVKLCAWTSSVHGADRAELRDDGAQWWAEWDDPEQQGRKRKAEALQEQHGEARRIWRLQLQDLPLQARQSSWARPCIHCQCGKHRNLGCCTCKTSLHRQA